VRWREDCAGWRHLALLAALQQRGTLRAWWRGLRTPKGLAWSALSGLVVLFFVVVGLAAPGASVAFVGQERLLALAPVVLLAFLACLTCIGLFYGFIFPSAADTHLLLPSPIGSHAFVLYQTRGHAVMLGAGAVLPALLVRSAHTSLASACLAYGSWAFIAVTTAVLADLSMTRRGARGRCRRSLLVTLGGALAACATFAAALAVTGSATRALAVVTLPASPFARLALGDGLPAEWSGLTGVLGLDAAALAVVALLRTDMRDVAHARGTAAAAAWQRLSRLGFTGLGAGARRGAAPAGRAGAGHTPGIGVPYLLGVGPHAWRQLRQLLRRPGRLAFVGLAAALCALPSLGLPWPQRHEIAALVAVLTVTFVGPLTLPAGFRADVGALPLLRMLPSPAWATVAGQVAPAASCLFVLELLVAVPGLLLAPPSRVPVWCTLVVGLPIVNVVQLAFLDTLALVRPLHALVADASQGSARGHVSAGAQLVATCGLLSLWLVVGGGVTAGAHALTRDVVASLIAGLVALVALAGSTLLAQSVTFRHSGLPGD
jgi:hypothetical protein